MKLLQIALFASLAVFATSFSNASQELITNGDFETEDFSGWTVRDQGLEGTGSFTIEAPGTNSTVPGLYSRPTPTNDSSNFYAVSDGNQGAPAVHVMLQNFTVTDPNQSILLSFQMFVNGWIWSSGSRADSATSDLFARVDILSSDADPFSLSTGVLLNIYNGIDPASTNAFQQYSQDISSVVATSGTYTLRFLVSDNISGPGTGSINQGVDNVHVTVQPVPEPTTMGFFGLGLAGLIWKGRKRFFGK